MISDHTRLAIVNPIDGTSGPSTKLAPIIIKVSSSQGCHDIGRLAVVDHAQLACKRNGTYSQL